MRTETQNTAGIALESERSALGCLFFGDRTHAADVFSNLTADDFLVPICAMAYPAMRYFYEEGIPIDAWLVVDRMRQTGIGLTPEQVAEVVGLEQWVINPNNILYHVKNIVTASRERLAEKMILAAQSGGESALERLQTLSGAAEKLVVADAEKRKNLHQGADAIRETFQEILSRIDNPGSGIKTNLTELDKMMGGLNPGELIIIAARPSVGKSAFAAQIGRAARDAGYHTFDAAYEMSRDWLVKRDVACEAGILLTSIRDGKMSTANVEKMHVAMQNMWKKWNGIYSVYDGMDGNPDMLWAQIELANANAANKRPVDLLIVDYLQLMNVRGKRFGSRNDEISEISRGLKRIAREFKIPVIALSQLSRDGEKEKRIPRLSDLRDSGAIEQDADVAMFLHRRVLGDAANGWLTQSDLVIAKQRNGPLGTIKLGFQSGFMRFAELGGATDGQH